MKSQELPFVWILKAVKCKECTKGTICVIILIFLFSAVKMSSEHSDIDNSPKYAFNEYNKDGTSMIIDSAQKQKSGKKKEKVPQSAHISVSGI